MKVARAKGRLHGKQPKLSSRQEAHLVALHGAVQHTISELEELFSITRSTVYRLWPATEPAPRPDRYISPAVGCGSPGPAGAVTVAEVPGWAGRRA